MAVGEISGVRTALTINTLSPRESGVGWGVGGGGVGGWFRENCGTIPGDSDAVH